VAEVTPAQIVERALNETKPGEDEHKKRTRRFDHAYDIYRASEPRPKSLEEWQSQIRVPYGMQVIDTAMVNLANQKPRCLVLPRSPDDDDRADGFQHVFDYYAYRDHLAEKNPIVTQSALIYGITVGKNHWLYRESDKMRRVYVNGAPHTQMARTVDYDGPSYEPWDVYDAWWDPAGRDIDSCAWVVLRSWPSKEDLIANSCTVDGKHDAIDCDGLYHDIERLLALGATKSPSQTAQDRFLQGGVQRKERFELLEVWRNDRLTVVGNRQVLLRDVPNPHWHAHKPVVVASTRPDLFKIQGIPETELIDHLQQALWTVQNMRMDNLHLTVMRGATYRESGVTDPTKLVIRPRALIPVTDHDDYQPIEFPPLPREAYEEEAQLLGRLQYVTGISPYVSGANLETVDQSTATGVNLLTEVASRLLTFKARQVQLGIWQRTFEQWGSDIQQFMEKPLWVRIDGQGGERSWREVGPEETTGEYDFILQGSDEDLSRSKERSDAVSLLNAFAPLAQLGIINWPVLIEKVGRAFGIDNPQTLIQPAPQQPQAAPFGQNGQAQQPPQLQGGAPIVGMPAQNILAGVRG
jgi:hypothetical protein